MTNKNTTSIIQKNVYDCVASSIFCFMNISLSYVFVFICTFYFHVKSYTC